MSVGSLESHHIFIDPTPFEYYIYVFRYVLLILTPPNLMEYRIHSLVSN